jgi:hypothetical protein
MAIIGISGAGKSYLLKSFVAKSVLHGTANVLAIDWNDEYRELIDFLSGRVLSFGSDFKINIMDVYSTPGSISNITEMIDAIVGLDPGQKSVLHTRLLELLTTNGPKSLGALIARTKECDILLSNRLLQLEGNPFFADKTEFDIKKILNGVYSISLSTLRDSSQRAELVRFILKLVIDSMHRMELGAAGRRILVLDEAWRLLKNSDEVGVLYREGRKYGISVISATQLASDINNEIMANVGCLAIFRLQSEKDYLILENAGLIPSSAKGDLSALGTGSCMLCLAYRANGGTPAKFYLERVDGMEFGNLQFFGEKMRHQISQKRFLEVTKALNDPELQEKVVAFSSQNGKNMEVSSFVRFLGEAGLDRASIVCYLRELGMDDLTIVNAYEIS